VQGAAAGATEGRRRPGRQAGEAAPAWMALLGEAAEAPPPGGPPYLADPELPLQTRSSEGDGPQPQQACLLLSLLLAV
jgi:hypothetical protein